MRAPLHCIIHIWNIWSSRPFLKTQRTIFHIWSSRPFLKTHKTIFPVISAELFLCFDYLEVGTCNSGNWKQLT